MAEFGIPMGGGSDSPVETLDPLWGIYCAVTRQDAQGWPEGGWNPQERLTVDQAVYLYTRGGAYQSFEENIKGMIAPGYLADLAVLSQDYIYDSSGRDSESPCGNDPYRRKDLLRSLNQS